MMSTNWQDKSSISTRWKISIRIQPFFGGKQEKKRENCVLWPICVFGHMFQTFETSIASKAPLVKLSALGGDRRNPSKYPTYLARMMNTSLLLSTWPDGFYSCLCRQQQCFVLIHVIVWWKAKCFADAAKSVKRVYRQKTICILNHGLRWRGLNHGGVNAGNQWTCTHHRLSVYLAQVSPGSVHHTCLLLTKEQDGRRIFNQFWILSRCRSHSFQGRDWKRVKGSMLIVSSVKGMQPNLMSMWRRLILTIISKLKP